MIETKTKRVDGKAICVYCTKPAKSDCSGSMHNNDWEDFWSCNCIGINTVATARKEINRLNNLIIDEQKKHAKWFNRKELKKKQKDLEDEYRYRI